MKPTLSPIFGVAGTTGAAGGGGGWAVVGVVEASAAGSSGELVGLGFAEGMGSIRTGGGVADIGAGLAKPGSRVSITTAWSKSANAEVIRAATTSVAGGSIVSSCLIS